MRALVARAQRGDHEAFDQLARMHGPDLYRLAVAVIGPDAAAEVGRTLAIPDGTPKSRLNAGLVALRHALQVPADA